MAMTFDDLLRRAVEANASDVHLKVGSPPVIRIDGELRRMEDLPSLRPADTKAIAEIIFDERVSKRFEEDGEVDFAYGRHDLGRFRVSAYRQRGSITLVMRRVVPGAPPLDRLGLPPVIEKLAGNTRGLLLVTGPSGSGRTTTMASIIEHINRTRPVSIITIEDPIEVLFPDKMAVVTQREVGVDTPDFRSAVSSALRQNADVIMMSIINDYDTAAAAITAAETGHLVVGAMHTADPVDTVNRIIEYYPPHQERTARKQLADNLVGIVSQRILEGAEGGRVLATEVLTTNPRVAELVVGGAPASSYVEIIKESDYFGMQTFDQALLDLVKRRRVAVMAALPHVRNSHEFRAKAMEAGVEVG